MNQPDSPDLSDTEQDLLARAARWQPKLGLLELSTSRLAEIARQEGINFATAVWHDRIQNFGDNGAFIRRVHDWRAVEAHTSIDLIGIVPGAFHGQHKHTGADGLRIVDIVSGMAERVEIVPVKSFGTLDENARIILDWLSARQGMRVMLVSLSKGGADVKWALASQEAPKAFAHVIAWASFSGITQGTPLIGWLRSRPLRSVAFKLLLRLQGHRARALDELRHGPGSPLDGWPHCPDHLQIVHVVGCPLPTHLAHRWASRGYARVAPFGPNDGGGILLADLRSAPGLVFPIWGVDHYLQPSWDIAPLLRKVLCAATPVNPAHATRSATRPITPPATRSSA